LTTGLYQPGLVLHELTTLNLVAPEYLSTIILKKLNNMKRIFAFSMSMVLALVSCESDPGVQLDPQELSLNEIDKNHAILVDAYAALNESLSKEAIFYIRKNGSTQAEFMASMYDKANEAFEKVLVKKFGEQAAVDYYIKIDGVNGESKGKLIDLLIQENAAGAFVSDVEQRLKNKSSSVDTWFIFKKLVTKGQARDMPLESISLNFTKVEAAIDVAANFLDLTLSDTELAEVMKDVFELQQMPPVAIALLLPAIQKSREPSKAMEAEEMYLKWIEEEVIPTTSGGLDRDIIRRKAFFEYLGALDLIISENYENENQLGASIAILKARYDFKLLSLWADYWHLEPAG
jgi:hypothetical protein